jgi:POT family proton-dependent oligopeptide transporter
LGTIGLPPLRPPTPSEEASLPQPAGPSALTSEERDRIGVIAVLAFFSIFFWVAFEQAGGLMNLYTDQKVDRHIFGWEMPTTWFQALNPVFIITLAPWGSRLWTYLAQRGKDPSPPLKMAIGIAFLSFGFVLMMGASLQSASVGKAHLLWVVGAYFFHTVGELCLSPIGLSVVTKLAPAHLGSLMMGVWFFANFLSDTLAGFVGAYSEHLGEFPLFGAIVVTTAVAALALATLSRSLVQRMHGRG